MTGTISSIHVARSSAGLDEDSARDVYQRVTGLRSLRAMTPQQQFATLSELRRLAPATSARVGGPYGKKLQALWISAYHLGIVHDRRDAALLAFVKRQTGLDATQFLRDAAAARKAVEALKGWLAREAKVDWSTHHDPVAAVIRAQGAILQLDMLGADDMTRIAQAWRAFRADEIEAHELRDVMKLFGDSIRGRHAAS